MVPRAARRCGPGSVRQQPLRSNITSGISLKPISRRQVFSAANANFHTIVRCPYSCSHTAFSRTTLFALSPGAPPQGSLPGPPSNPPSILPSSTGI